MKKPATSNQEPVTKLGATQLRISKPTSRDISKLRRRNIFIICDNILDTYNIGSIFRLADAVAVKKIYLCGATETPPNSRISKSSVGTDKWVEWQYASTAAEAIEAVRNRHSRPARESDPRLREDDKGREIKVIAIEQNPKAIDYRKADFKEPVAFVIGHETSGVSREALKACDQVVEIPMFGVNKSLNVMVSLAVVLYQAI